MGVIAMICLFCILEPIMIANVAFTTEGLDCRKTKIRKEKSAVLYNLTLQLD